MSKENNEISYAARNVDSISMGLTKGPMKQEESLNQFFLFVDYVLQRKNQFYLNYFLILGNI
jgi:hypothetical protein